jgi:hypothetical protein
MVETEELDLAVGSFGKGRAGAGDCGVSGWCGHFRQASKYQLCYRSHFSQSHVHIGASRLDNVNVYCALVTQTRIDLVRLRCGVTVDDSTAIRPEIDTAIDAGIAGDRRVGQGVLMLIVVDAKPDDTAVIGAIDAPNSEDLRAAIECRIFVKWRWHAKADGGGSLDLR